MEGTVIIASSEIRMIIREEISNALRKEIETKEINNVNKRYLLEDAAHYLQMAIPTLRVYREKIGGTKIGKRWIFTQEELDKFLEKHRSRPLTYK